MLDLRVYANKAKDKIITDKDREVFKTIGFDPDELWQLKEMKERELRLLMVFCGIRVCDGVPFVVMDEDEMRLAYVFWRADMVKEKNREVYEKMKRGIKWMEHFLGAAKIWSRLI